MLKKESFQWQEETQKTLQIFIRSTLGQKLFPKEEVQIFFKILEAFWTVVHGGRVIIIKAILKNRRVKLRVALLDKRVVGCK
jgi:hypothetical protein